MGLYFLYYILWRSKNCWVHTKFGPILSSRSSKFSSLTPRTSKRKVMRTLASRKRLVTPSVNIQIFELMTNHWDHVLLFPIWRLFVMVLTGKGFKYLCIGLEHNTITNSDTKKNTPDNILSEKSSILKISNNPRSRFR